MRRLLLPIAAILALLALPAMGQDKGRITVIQPAPKAGLRPSQTADLDALGLAGPRAPAPQAIGGSPRTAGEQQRLSAANPPLPFLNALPAPTRPDAGQCRIGCAQTYYFCAAADASDECSATWAQCRASCEPSASWRAPIGLGSGG